MTKCFIILCSFSLQKHVEFSSKMVFEEVISPASSLSNFCRKTSSVCVDDNGGNLQVLLKLQLLGL